MGSSSAWIFNSYRLASKDVAQRGENRHDDRGGQEEGCSGPEGLDGIAAEVFGESWQGDGKRSGVEGGGKG